MSLTILVNAAFLSTFGCVFVYSLTIVSISSGVNSKLSVFKEVETASL